jgi:hypothetical protein
MVVLSMNKPVSPLKGATLMYENSSYVPSHSCGCTRPRRTSLTQSILCRRIGHTENPREEFSASRDMRPPTTTYKRDTRFGWGMCRGASSMNRVRSL